MKRLSALVGLTFALLVSPAAAAGDVASGPLRAGITADPWGMVFSQADGGPTLSESAGRGSGPDGSLGFRTALGWWHATRTLSEQIADGGYGAELATNDPLGRRIQVSIVPGIDGAIDIEATVVGPSIADVEAVGIGFDAPEGERYLGFGERSNAVDQRGNEVESYVADGPYQSEERPFMRAFIPPQGFSDRDDATYFPMPWLLSSAGYGVLITNTELSYFRLGTERANTWSMEVESPSLRFSIFAGPRPVDVVGRLTEQIGRQPPARAPWFFGPWYQPIGAVTEEAEMLRDADVPASVANTFLHYLPCGDHVGRDEVPFTTGMHELGYAVTTYFNPMICNTYQPTFDEAAAAGVLTMDGSGDPYVYRYTSGVGPDREFMVGQFDFSNPAADDFYAELLSEATDAGFDGWMEDFGEYTPLDSRSANGMGGEEMHNLYPVLYHRSSWRFAKQQERPIAGYIRSGYTGVHPYAQLVWGGDPTQDWGFDGLESAMYQGLNMGASGITRWGSAIGGFFALGTHNRTPELLVRWIQLGAVSGIMRTEKNGVSLPPRSRPHITDPEILPIWRRYTKLRTQLYPYIRAADAAYRRKGVPAMRHMALAFPGDPKAVARDDQFMFGPDLLVAPVVAPGQTEQQVYLPKGAWFNLADALQYREGKGQFKLGKTTRLPSGKQVTVDAPLEQLPLFARGGALIAMLPPTVDTLTDYGARSGDGIVHLADRRGRLRLLAFPRGTSHARFDTSGRIKSRELKNGWRLAIKGTRGGRYRVQASLAALRRGFDPCAVRVNGRPLGQRRWSYDRKTDVLRVTVHARGKRARMVVPRSCG